MTESGFEAAIWKKRLTESGFEAAIWRKRMTESGFEAAIWRKRMTESGFEAAIWRKRMTESGFEAAIGRKRVTESGFEAAPQHQYKICLLLRLHRLARALQFLRLPGLLRLHAAHEQRSCAPPLPRLQLRLLQE